MDMAHNIFADTDIEFFIEPGRALVADAGIIETEVILTSYKNRTNTRTGKMGIY